MTDNSVAELDKLLEQFGAPSKGSPSSSRPTSVNPSPRASATVTQQHIPPSSKGGAQLNRKPSTGSVGSPSGSGSSSPNSASPREGGLRANRTPRQFATTSNSTTPRGDVYAAESELDSLISNLDTNFKNLSNERTGLKLDSASIYSDQKVVPKENSARLKELERQQEVKEHTARFNLSDEEYALVKELNQARRNPASYADYLEKHRKPYFVDGGNDLDLPDSELLLRTKEGVRGVDIAINFLRSQRPLGELKASAGLSSAAKDLVSEKGPEGVQMWEDNFQARIARWGSLAGEAIELANFGDADAREQTCRLIISDGDPDRGFRRQLFDPRWTTVGVNIGAHASSFKKMKIIIFAEGFKEF